MEMEKMKETVKTKVENAAMEDSTQNPQVQTNGCVPQCVVEEVSDKEQPSPSMASITPFNPISNSLIENVFLAASRHPGFAGCVILRDSETYKDMGAIGIKVLRNKVPLNLFLFFPAPDGSGEIGSVAIYGIQLSEHKRAIEQTMTLFGLPVDSVGWDKGKEPYVDVTIKSYR